jgi:hypothetical protein
VAGSGFSLTVEIPECTDNKTKASLCWRPTGWSALKLEEAPAGTAQLQTTRHYHGAFARHPLAQLLHSGPGQRAQSICLLATAGQQCA